MHLVWIHLVRWYGVTWCGLNWLVDMFQGLAVGEAQQDTELGDKHTSLTSTEWCIA
jgi:CYTH domain-containing protein